MISAEFRTYFQEQQVSLQWLPVLRALALELAARDTPEILRNLFANMGGRIGEEAGAQVEGLSSMTALQERLCQFWGDMSWGFVRLKETQGGIQIEHHASPLIEAFGNDALSWSCGFLEGFYQSIFLRLGAQDNLKVHWVSVTNDGLTLNFEFGL